MPDLVSRVERAVRAEGASPAELAMAAAVRRLLTERGAMTVDELVAHFRDIFGSAPEPLPEAEMVRRLLAAQGE